MSSNGHRYPLQRVLGHEKLRHISRGHQQQSSVYVCENWAATKISRKNMLSTGAWSRWERLIRRGCQSATPIGLDDAMAHVEGYFAGSEILGDNLKCRLARKLRLVEDRFEAARLAADSCPSAEPPAFAPVPRRTRRVWARMCVSAKDARCDRGLDAFLSLEVASTGETLLLFECDQLKPRRVKLSFLRFTFASDRVLGMHGVVTRDQTVASMSCYLLFDDDASLKRFTAMCNGY